MELLQIATTFLLQSATRFITNCDSTVESLEYLSNMKGNKKVVVKDAGSGGGDYHMKGAGMLVVSLRGVNFGFWSHLGYSVLVKSN